MTQLLGIQVVAAEPASFGPPCEKAPGRREFPRGRFRVAAQSAGKRKAKQDAATTRVSNPGGVL